MQGFLYSRGDEKTANARVRPKVGNKEKLTTLHFWPYRRAAFHLSLLFYPTQEASHA